MQKASNPWQVLSKMARETQNLIKMKTILLLKELRVLVKDRKEVKVEMMNSVLISTAMYSIARR